MNVFGFTVQAAVIQSLGWTLIDFVWQGALVAATLAVFDALLARGRPQVRYLAGCVALLVMFALPVMTYVNRAANHRAQASAAIATPTRGRVISAPTGAAIAVADPASAARSIRSEALAAAARRARAIDRAAALPSLGLRPSAVRMSPALLPWLVGLWSVGVGLLTLRLLGGCWLVRRLRHSTLNVGVPDWQETVTRLATRMGVSRPVRLVRSGLVTVPTAIGWLRPVILLPATTLTGLSAIQIEAILAHELAHIRRHDYVINLLQSVIETLLFYHPAVWWVSRRLREERELCCDDLAVRASGDALSYARALCELEELRGTEARLVLAATGGSLVTRIARLLGVNQRSHLETTRGFAWALVASLVLVVGAAGGTVRSDPAKAPVRSPHPARLVRRAVLARAALPALAPLPTSAAPAPLVPQSALAALAIADETLAAAMAALQANVVVAAAEAVETPETPEPALACKDASDAKEASDESDASEPVDESATPIPGTTSGRFSSAEWQRLAQAGVDTRYVSALERGGYTDLSVDQLISLAQHGVSSAYATAMRKSLGDPSVEDLVQLANHGVTARYANTMRRSLGDVGVEDLVRLASHGVTPEFVAGMSELDLNDLTAEDLIRLANAGVTLEWFASLRWAGYSDLTVERAIQLRNAGVTADYAASLRLMKRQPLTLDELRTLQNQGVDVEYAATMLGLLRKDLSVEQLIRLRNQGVDVDFVASMNALGYSKLSPEDLIMLRQQGIDAEFVAGMSGAGYRGLPVRDLVQLRQSGVTPEFAERVRLAGYEGLEVSELIRLAQQGLLSTPRVRKR